MTQQAGERRRQLRTAHVGLKGLAVRSGMLALAVACAPTLLNAQTAVVTLQSQTAPALPPSAVAPASAAPALSIQGVGLTSASLTTADLTRMPRTTVDVEQHGKHDKYEGVALATLLGRYGAPFGDALRGENMTLVVIIKAADNYHAVFALAELDPAFSHHIVLLADQKNGAPLDAHEGPLRIIATGDKREARGVRQVISLTLAKAQ